MPVFNVEVVQVYRATRRIIVPIEAADLASALEDQASGDAPAFDHPGWRTGWDLQNEQRHAPDDFAQDGPAQKRFRVKVVETNITTYETAEVEAADDEAAAVIAEDMRVKGFLEVQYDTCTGVKISAVEIDS